MQVKFNGIYNLKDFATALNEIVEQLKAEEVYQLYNINLYFTARDNRGLEIEFVDEFDNEMLWNHVCENNKVRTIKKIN